jgi:DNA-binding transcriptional regulator GbsR (MarR family)
MPINKSKPVFDNGKMKHRIIVLNHLNTPLTALELSKITNIPMSRVWYVLSELQDQKLIQRSKKKQIGNYLRKSYIKL